MRSSPLENISPIDGRYSEKCEPLVKYFSELALFRYRVLVEIEYFIALTAIPLPQLKGFDTSYFESLRAIYINFGVEEGQRIKELERVTNHDIKAVEYYIKEHFIALGLERYTQFIHFGLTSQDINNSAVPLSLKEGIEEFYTPLLYSLIEELHKFAKEWSEVPMLARTHGQPASPTMLGKEFAVFATRLEEQAAILKSVKYGAKFGGATGNFNAHIVAYPTVEWNRFAKEFIEGKLGLYRSYPTTQIEHYDHLASLFDSLKRIDTILIDLCQDIWLYISIDYFKQKIKSGEVGSSAMPHKVNPIDFENGEGNLGVANALFAHLAAKLPISRLQRDLTDSTVLRNIGVPIAHATIAIDSIKRGLNKLILNREAIDRDLNQNWAVVAEAIQTILRREGYPSPYEALKELTRTNVAIGKDQIAAFIERLQISERVKEELRTITPHNYTGAKL
ncbi:MAG: adenylosuccinate lyase [Bacteroidales bacterium]